MKESIHKLKHALTIGQVSGPVASEEADDLLVYPPVNNNIKWFFQPRSGTVVTPGGSPVVLDCTNKTMGQDTRNLVCRTEVLLPEGIRATYLFHERFLEDWRNIHVTMLELIENMRGDCK